MWQKGMYKQRCIYQGTSKNKCPLGTQRKGISKKKIMLCRRWHLNFILKNCDISVSEIGQETEIVVVDMTKQRYRCWKEQALFEDHGTCLRVNFVRMLKEKVTIQYNRNNGQHLSKRTAGSGLDFSMCKMEREEDRRPSQEVFSITPKGDELGQRNRKEWSEFIAFLGWEYSIFWN